MFCPKCGGKSFEAAEFCHNCGFILQKVNIYQPNKQENTQQSKQIFSKKFGDKWDWVLLLLGVIIAKIFSLVGAVIMFGIYYWLKPRLGILKAIGISLIVGLLFAIIAGYYFHNKYSKPIASNTLEENKDIQLQEKDVIDFSYNNESSNILPVASNDGVITEIGGLSNDGNFLLEIKNISNNWKVTSIKVTLTNSSQYTEVLNGYRIEPAYTENYYTQVSIPPRTNQSLKVPVKWDYNVGFLAWVQPYGSKIN